MVDGLWWQMKVPSDRLSNFVTALCETVRVMQLGDCCSDSRTD